jgi:putative DNA primase/helicase
VSLEELEAEHGALPQTARSKTANGGQHLFFRHPGQQVRNLVGTIGVGLDVRGDGGYVLAPGSSLGAGRDYEWLNQEDGVLEAPQWLIEKVTGRQSTKDPLEIAEVLNGVPEGQRDFKLFRMACSLRAAGVPREFAEDLAVNAARKCEPPFDEALALEKVARAYRQYNQNYAWTDVGNAERLVDRHGQNIRYGNNGKWYIWDGVRWAMDIGSTALGLAIETTQAIVNQGREMDATTDQEREHRDELMKFGRASQNVNRVQAMLTLAAADPSLQIDVDTLDSDPFLLNCPNGTVDLRTGQLRPHSRADFISLVTRTPYDPGAPAPRWEAFLERIIPDQEVRAFLHRAVGYSITGHVGEQCFFFLHGSGANGKSTFLNVLRMALGRYAKVGTPDLLLQTKSDSHPTSLADMVGVRFVPSIEAEDGKKMAEAQVKWLTGDDKLKARFMRQDYFEFEPRLHIWLAANHRPYVTGTDAGIWRRINLVSFTVAIPPEEQVKGLTDILVREESTGILAWAIRGAQRWMREGLNPPDQVKAALAAYRADQDILGQFMDECVEKDELAKPLAANDLYAAFLGWCQQNGERETTQRRFTNSITELGNVRERGTGNRYFWKGLKLTGAGKEYAVSRGGGVSYAMPELN